MNKQDVQSASIAADNLHFRYAGADADALEGITFEFESQSIAALVGPSGCGKSTLLRLIAGLLNPSAGSLRIGDIDAANLSPERRLIGWVPQSYALFNHLTIAENVAFGLRARGVGKKEAALRVAECLELCQMSAFATRYPAALSGGQRQRVAIARALAPRPRVLLLDEPLAALDPQLRKSLRVALTGLLRDSGVTSIMVTHDQSEALAMADTIAVMRSGRIEQIASPEVLWNRPANAFVADFVASAWVVAAHREGSRHRIVSGLDVDLGPVASADAVVAIRPADLAISDSGAELRVLSHEYAGDSWLISGVLQETGQTVAVLHDQRIEIGHVTTVSVRPEARIAEVQA